MTPASKTYNAVFLFCLLLSPFLGGTQTAPAPAPAQAAPLKIVVIPFHPIRFYFSDCDRNLSQKSKIELQDIRNNFRAGLDYAAEEALEKKYEPINLLQLKDSTAARILSKYYDNVSYAYASPSGSLPKKQEKELKKFREQISEASLRPLTGAKAANGEEECYTQIEKEDPQYMRASINPEFLEEMNAEYHPDLYVTINQFEVKTDYERCIDRELGVFTRRIKVHYNVFDSNGKLIYGDVVTARYNSNSDELKKIVNDNFGFLTEYITRSIP